MAITEADNASLPLVRRLEAAGFRAWPARSVSYDGSWQVRMTPGHPSKRLNGIVPLDPFDSKDMLGRLHSAEARFRAAGITPSLRQSPLCPPALRDILEKDGWVIGSMTNVMVGNIDRFDLSHGIDHLPTHDVLRFAEACVRIDEARDTTPTVLSGIISAIEPTAGLFLIENQEGPEAVGICVHDNDLAGLQQIVVRKDLRGRHTGLDLVSMALRWARLRGARMAWLQVLADNAPANALYEKIGFRVAYRYGYWKRPQT